MYVRDEQGNIYSDALGKRWWIDNFLQGNFTFVQSKVSHKIAHRRSDLFIIVDGPVGSGKSTLSFQCAKWFDPTFNLSRVVFSVEDFLRVLIEASPGQAVVFDEAIIVNSRSALTEFNKMIIIAMTQIRSKGLYIFFNIPSVFDLDRNLVLNRCHLLLHCYQDRFGDRGKYNAFDHDKLKLLYLKGKRLYSYAFPKANFIGRFSEYFFLDREEYENKKQREIAKQAKSKKKNKFLSQRNLTIILLAKVLKKLYPDKTLQQIFDFLGEKLGYMSSYEFNRAYFEGNRETKQELSRQNEPRVVKTSIFEGDNE